IFFRFARLAAAQRKFHSGDNRRTPKDASRHTDLVSRALPSQDSRQEGEICMAGRLQELLVRGKLVKVFCVGQLCQPKIVEIIGQHGGYDAVWLDQEHAGLSIAQIELACLAARAAGLETFVRLAPTDYAAVMR